LKSGKGLGGGKRRKECRRVKGNISNRERRGYFCKKGHRNSQEQKKIFQAYGGGGKETEGGVRMGTVHPRRGLFFLKFFISSVDIKVGKGKKGAAST